jgi:hypothetical protein
MRRLHRECKRGKNQRDETLSANYHGYGPPFNNVRLKNVAKNSQLNNKAITIPMSRFDDSPKFPLKVAVI